MQYRPIHGAYSGNKDLPWPADCTNQNAFMNRLVSGGVDFSPKHLLLHALALGHAPEAWSHYHVPIIIMTRQEGQ